jgi:sugar-specific transcriptional regulator TrmB
MINTSLFEQIKKAGLTDKAALVYTVLLQTGGAYPTKIAEITKLNRSTVYMVLTDLCIKGLVNEIERSKKQFYQIEKPQKLSQLANDQVKRAMETSEYIKGIIPEIEETYLKITNRPRIRYFADTPGIHSIYEEQTADDLKPYEMLSITTTNSIDVLLPEKFYEEFRRRKARLGITTRVLLTDSEVNQEYVKTIYKNLPEKIWPVIRFVPPPIQTYGSEITIYGDNKVSIINFQKENPIGVVIEDEALHKIMRMVFDLAWKGAAQEE